MSQLTQKESFDVATKEQFGTESIRLGPWTSYSLLNDPKHMCFVLARYKFCAKMLDGKQDLLEIGCGDGFGAPILAQHVKSYYGIDVDDRLILGDRERLAQVKNVSFENRDLCINPPTRTFDAICSIDVIEHLDQPLEKTFMENSWRCLKSDGVCIVGTPNITASPYASERSAVQHINLKSHASLRALMARYFSNVFMFSMNDEVVHTGYGPMAHYLFAVGAGKKEALQ